MTDDESPKPTRQPKTIAEQLLMMAERSPELRAALIERWARAETWTCLEGIALAWTIDPKSLADKALRRSGMKWELPEEARHYLDLAYRSSDPEMSRDRVDPLRFIAWAHDSGLAFHPDWYRAVSQAQSGASLRPPRTEADRTRKRLVTAWARSPYWAPEEGAVLAYDLDSKAAVEHSTTGYDGPSLRAPADARQLLSFAHRAIEVGTLDEKPAPVRFMEWARSTGVEFHPDWWNAVVDGPASASPEIEKPPPATPILDLKTREQESLLKMVAGMAIGFYGWEPEKLRNPATTEIARDLAEAGVSLDPETIRKWLRKGYDLIDRSDR